MHTAVSYIQTKPHRVYQMPKQWKDEPSASTHPKKCKHHRNNSQSKQCANNERVNHLLSATKMHAPYKLPSACASVASGHQKYTADSKSDPYCSYCVSGAPSDGWRWRECMQSISTESACYQSQQRMYAINLNMQSFSTDNVCNQSQQRMHAINLNKKCMQSFSTENICNQSWVV